MVPSHSEPALSGGQKRLRDDILETMSETNGGGSITAATLEAALLVVVV